MFLLIADKKIHETTTIAHSASSDRSIGWIDWNVLSCWKREEVRNRADS